MIRCVAFALALFLIFALCACGSGSSHAEAEQGGAAAPVIQALPESTFMFCGIPWGTSQSSAIDMVKARFPDINTIEQNNRPKFQSTNHYLESFNYSDPQGKLSPSISTRAVNTRVVSLKNMSSGKYPISLSVGSVAGHKVYSIILYFYEFEEEYRLYKAEYCFADPVDMEAIEQFSDIQTKMENLYGASLAYAYDTAVPVESTHACVAWLSDDMSAAYLEYTFYLSGSYLLNGSESVTLCYGTISVNNFFLSADEQRQEQEELERQERIGEIASDDSGL